MPLYPPAINLTAPGPIGVTTPSTVRGTTITATTAVISPNINVAGGAFILSNSGLSGTGGINVAGILSVESGTISSDGSGGLTINSLNSDAGAIVSDGFGSLLIQGALQVQSNVQFTLPTSDPHNAGELWSNLGIVTSSQG